MKEFLELGSWVHCFSGPSSRWVSSSFGRPVCSEVGECPTFRCLRFLRGLCLYPSRQQRSRYLTLCFYWPCRFSPSPVGSVCFGGVTVIPFTWAFMHWPYTHGGSLAALPEVGLLGKGCCRFPSGWGHSFWVRFSQPDLK